MNISTNTTRLCFVSGCIALLSGCVANSPMPNLEMIERREQALDASNDISISVEQLLARARGQANDQPIKQTKLELIFSSETTELSPGQQDKLNTYANQLQPQTLQVTCAPSQTTDPVLAASKGVTRCVTVGQFLEKRAHATQIKLVPSMNRDVVRVQADN